MNFEFATATRIIFGEGRAATLPELARSFGARALVVTGASAERARPLISSLSAEIFSLAEEPTAEVVREGARRAKDAACNVVVSIGGGSVIDAGKAIAALATNGGEPLDFLEVVGKGREIQSPPLPFIAVPTTAGTGSEVTRNAVLGSPEHGVKASMRSPFMLPRVALIDPELTYGLPPAITAYTGLDALTQLIEPYVSARANPLVDAICREGIRLAAGALLRAYRDGRDKDARRDMSVASLFGGLALANAGLGVVHGFAAPLGGLSVSRIALHFKILEPLLNQRQLTASDETAASEIFPAGRARPANERHERHDGRLLWPPAGGTQAGYGRLWSLWSEARSAQDARGAQ